MAITRRRPQAGLVHHSDQGSQPVSLRLGERCREIGIHRSARKATASTTPSPRASSPRLRRACSALHSFVTRQEARTAVFDYIEAFYNPVRLHPTLDYLSPIGYEKMNRQDEKGRLIKGDPVESARVVTAVAAVPPLG